MDGREVYGDNHFWFYAFYAEELLSGIDYGNHTLEVKYLGNQYDPTSYKSTFYYSYVDLHADSEGHIIIESEEEMSAKLYLDGDLIYDGKIDGYTAVSSKNLYRGYVPNYTLITSGKGKYNAVTLTGALDYWVYPEIDVPFMMGEGDDKYIRFTLPPDACGNLKVYINDNDVNASFENGKSVIPLNALDIGDYRVRIVYDSDSKYESYDGDYYNVKVTYNPNLKITVPSVAYLTDSTVTFTGSKDVEGKISIYVDRIDKTFKGDYKNGIAKIKIFDEEPGPKTYHYKFEGTYNGEKFEYDGEFNVTLTLLTVSLPKTVYEGQSFKVTFTGPQSMNGVLEASYAVNEGVIVKKGKATLTFSGLKAGVKKISYYFREFSSSFKVNVIKPPVIKANDFKTLYTSKKAYTVRILNNQSKSVGAGKTVTFYLYKAGKVKETKTSKTDSKGYAKVNFNVAPGSYKVKTKYGATAVTKKYAIKPITTTKNVQKYKRYNGLSQLVTAKNFVFQASLKKVDGKYLKGKNVQITFYRQNKKGNLFKAYSTTKKTDSKGVVKFIISVCLLKFHQVSWKVFLLALRFHI